MRLVTCRNSILAFLFFCLLGCGRVDPDHPPKIHYGRDVCDECGMIISEKQFAAASVDRDGNITKFDGIGCLILYQAKHPSAVQWNWVHDYQSEEWIEVDNAFFVNTEKLVTPMAFGLVAFSSKRVASQFVHEEGGALVELNELPAIVQKKVERV